MSIIPNPHPRLKQKSTNPKFAGITLCDILAMCNGGLVIDSNHLLQCPGRPGWVTHKMLPEALTQYTMTPRIAVLHTQAGAKKASNNAAWNWANRVEVKGEAHCYGPEMKGGNRLQAMPLNRVAHSQYQADDFFLPGDKTRYSAVCWESQDEGHATLRTTPWTVDQLEAFIADLTAVCFTYRIRCTAPAWFQDSGIGPHNLFPQWSLDAHSCPENARTRQMDYIRQEVAARVAQCYDFAGESCP